MLIHLESKEFGFHVNLSIQKILKDKNCSYLPFCSDQWISVILLFLYLTLDLLAELTFQ